MSPDRHPRASGRRLAAWFVLAAIAVTGVAGSSPEVAGPGAAAQNVAIALNLLDGEGLSFTAERLETVETLVRRQLPATEGGVLTETAAPLPGTTDRWAFPRNWAYAAVASPFVWLSRRVGATAIAGFTLLNLLALLGTFWIVSRDLDAVAALLVFAGPVIWWLDKAAAVAVLFSLIAVAAGCLRDRPRWSLLGIAALAAGSLAGDLLVPAPYAPVGVSPVSQLAVSLFDLNLGLLWNVPVVSLAVVAAGALGLRHGEVRGLAVDAAVILGGCLVAAWWSPSMQLNAPGSPALSRLAFLILPLSLVVLRRVDWTATESPGRLLLTGTLVSALWSVLLFHPALPEAARLEPSLPADLVWTHLPTLSNPPPEIFAERTSRQEPGSVPVATADCRKVLIVDATWPMPCPPSAILPEECRDFGDQCYANLRGGSYTFTPAPGHLRPAFTRADATWPPSVETVVGETMRRLRWWEMRRVQPGSPGAFVRAVHDVGRAITWQARSDARTFVYLSDLGDAARIDTRYAAPMIGRLVDPRSGEAIEETTIPAAVGSGMQTIALPSRGRLLLTVHPRNAATDD